MDIEKVFNIKYMQLSREQYLQIVNYAGEVRRGNRPLPEFPLTFKEVPAINFNKIVQYPELSVGDNRVLPFEILDRGRQLLPSKYLTGNVVNFMVACYKFLRNDDLLQSSADAIEYLNLIGQAIEEIKKNQITKETVHEDNSIDQLVAVLKNVYGRDLPTAKINNRKNVEEALLSEVFKSLAPEKREYLSRSEQTILEKIFRTKGGIVCNQFKNETFKSMSAVYDFEDDPAHSFVDTYRSTVADEKSKSISIVDNIEDYEKEYIKKMIRLFASADRLRDIGIKTAVI